MPWAYVNKSVFGKFLSGIEKVVKNFSIPNKTFSKNSILLCALRAHISKILLSLFTSSLFSLFSFFLRWFRRFSLFPFSFFFLSYLDSFSFLSFTILSSLSLTPLSLSLPCESSLLNKWKRWVCSSSWETKATD